MRAGFRQGVQCDELIRCLSGRDGMPKTWAKLMTAAKVYAQTEKSLTGGRAPTRLDASPSSGGKNKKNKGPVWSRMQMPVDALPPITSDARNLINEKHKDQRHARGREHQWHSITKSSAQVLATENNQFKAPRPMHNKKNQDPNKYCEFHKDTCHSTDDYINLKLEIEAALRDGELTHILKKRGATTR